MAYAGTFVSFPEWQARRRAMLTLLYPVVGAASSADVAGDGQLASAARLIQVVVVTP
jgi:hypothetical protein